MREIRLYGSEGGEVKAFPTPIFFVFKKDSRRASLAGMTPLGDRACHIAPFLSMTFSKESLNLGVNTNQVE